MAVVTCQVYAVFALENPPTKNTIMKKNDNNSFRMYLAVQMILDMFAATWAGLVSMTTTSTEFDALIAKIKADLEIQKAGITGFAQEKKKKKFEMATAAYALCRKVRSFAYAVDNRELVGKLKIYFSLIYYGTSNKAVAYSKNILKAAQDMSAADKVTYGITAAEITALSDMIMAFDSYTSSPRGEIIVRTVATENIRANCKLVNRMLKDRMDNEMANFEFSHPDFFAQYKEARKVIDLHRQTVIEGNVTDTDGADLRRVKVTIVGKDKVTNEEKVVFEEMTDKDGNFAKRLINPELEYDLSFELEHYEKQTYSNVDLIAGEHELFDVKLLKITV